MSELRLTTETIKRFRQAYVTRFGAATRDDMLYEAVSEGRRHPGVEHWLPLFHERLDSLFDYLDDAPICSTPWPRTPPASGWGRSPTITDARRNALDKNALEKASAGTPYKPLPPDRSI